MEPETDATRNFPVEHLGHLQGYKAAGVSSLISFMLKNTNWLGTTWLLPSCHLSRTFPKPRVTGMLLFSSQNLYFDQWSLRQHVLNLLKICYVGETKAERQPLYFLTPGNPVLLASQPGLLDFWPFAWLCLSLFVPWQSYCRSFCFALILLYVGPYSEYLCLAGSPTWHNIAIETVSKMVEALLFYARNTELSDHWE